MIIEYHRPASIEQALELLSRQEPTTYALGGGTKLVHERKANIAVVDLQNLGLNQITQEGQLLRIGASATLQALLDFHYPETIDEALHISLEHETGANIRQTATIAGTLVSCDARSPFVTALLALDPRLIWAPDGQPEGLGDYLPLRQASTKNRLMVDIRVPLNATLRFASVARSPMDRPIVCAAVVTWPSGRTRVTLGGFGRAPIMVMDGPEAGGAVPATREALRSSADGWASAEYRMEVAGKLVQRMIKGLG